LIPKSPKLRTLPLVAIPLLWPFCCFLNLTRLGANIKASPVSHGSRPLPVFAKGLEFIQSGSSILVDPDPRGSVALQV
jgi:hypothetical protein